MRQTDLKRYKKILLDRRERLTGTLSSMQTEALKPNGSGQEVDENADYGSDQFEQELTLGLIESEQGEMVLIEGALVRIEDGTFGKCDECEQLIPKPRLEALPYAKYCIKCQSDKERSGEI
jgi:DnaK suppressor protein